MIIVDILKLLAQPNKYGCFAFARSNERAAWLAFNGHHLEAAGCTASNEGRYWRSPTSSYLLLLDETDIVSEGCRFDKVWTRGELQPRTLDLLRQKERLVHGLWPT